MVRGRNAEKRRVGKGWERRAHFVLNRLVVLSGAKRNTAARVQQLADRRLRQRRQRPSY